MATLVAAIVGVAALLSGEWRYGMLSLALAIALFVADSSTNDTGQWQWVPGGLSVLLAATAIAIAALLAREWLVVIPAVLVALAALAAGSGGVELKAFAVIAAVVLTLLIMAPAKVLIVLVAAALVIPLLIWASTGENSGSAGCMPVLAAIGIVIGAVYLWYHVEEKEREANVDRYGTAVFDLCVSPAELPAAGSAVAGGKVLFVESGQGNRGKMMGDYSSKLPGRYRAHNQTEVAEVICIASGQEVYGTGTYTNGAVCTRYQRYVHAYLVDTATGHLIADRNFYGPTPSSCPSTTRQTSVTVTGKSPSAQAVVDWVLTHIQESTGL